MIENIYDSEKFFSSYAQMSRSKDGLAGAGEWGQFRKLLPDLSGLAVLDMGSGYGWHSKYAAEQGAASVYAFDVSEKMIAKAEAINSDEKIEYAVADLENFDFPDQRFDLVISNLVLHYVENLNNIYAKVHQTLKDNGLFVFNIEHPCFTAGVKEDWAYGPDGEILNWPIDNYFYPGERQTNFLGHQVRKYHHTLTQILNGLPD